MISSLTFKIDELNWDGTDEEVAMDLINQVRLMDIPLREITKSKPCKSKTIQTFNFTLIGKNYKVRNDHNESTPGPNPPQISTRCIINPKKV